MSYSIPLQFKGTTSKVDEEGVTVYKAIASTDALDRDREVLLPKGAITENFMKNPVMLFIHNYRSMPVGSVKSLEVEDEKIIFDFTFADSSLGKELESAYKSGLMNAFSVGFYPQKALWIEDDTPDQLTVEVADGTQTLDLTKYKERPRAVISKWELLEISPVPVPANPEALLLRAKEEIVRKMYDGDVKSAQGQLFEQQVTKELDSVTAHLRTFMSLLDSAEVAKVIPLHNVKIDKDAKWDSTKAKASLAKWASEDGTGNKDTIDWGKYSSGFAYVNTDKAGNFSAYKYPHHVVQGDELVTVSKGVAEAMGSLLQEFKTQEELESDEFAKGVYDHLKDHYVQAEKTPPAFSVEYSAEEFKAIEEDRWDDYVKEQTEESDNDPVETTLEVTEAELKELFTNEFKNLAQLVSESEETLSVRMNILSDSIEEVLVSIEKMLKMLDTKSSESPPVENDPADEAKTLSDAQDTLNAIRKKLGLETVS